MIDHDYQQLSSNDREVPHGLKITENVITNVWTITPARYINNYSSRFGISKFSNSIIIYSLMMLTIYIDTIEIEGA